VDSGQRELVFVCVGEFLVVLHELLLVVELVADMEKDSVLKGRFRFVFVGNLLGFLVHLHVKVNRSKMELDLRWRFAVVSG
jgi:hypothetical protein